MTDTTLPDQTIASARLRGLVLDLWARGQSSTFCIASELQLPEEEVCHILQEAGLPLSEAMSGGQTS
jgi:hypothetical protein